MAVEVFVSTLNFGTGPMSEVMGRLGRLAYESVEISSGHRSEDESLSPVLSYARARKASVILHNYAPPEPGNLLINLSDPDSDTRDQVVRFLKSRIEFTRELGSDYYSFHAGYRVPYRFGIRDYDASQVLGRELALEIFGEALKPVLAHAELHGVHIGVENHVVERGNQGNLILYDQGDFEVLFQGFDSEFLHLHLDIGHLKVTCESLHLDPRAFLTQFRDKIMTVHLHDNDGKVDQHQPFGKDAWFLEHLGNLTRLRYACLETDTSGNGELIDRMGRLLKAL